MTDGRAMRGCHGNGPDHCCYQAGQVCPFLEMNTEPGRRWTCGLRRELGSWDAVHADPRYLEHVKPHWDRTGTRDCGEFGPLEGQCCWGPAGAPNGWPDPVPEGQITPRCKLPLPGRFDERGN